MRYIRYIRHVRYVMYVTHVRYMRKQFDTRKQVTVYLSAEEYAAIEALASGNVSKYARKALLAGIQERPREPSAIPDVQPELAIRTDGRRKSVPNRIVASLREQIPELKTANELPAKSAHTVKRCAHGEAKGYHCWKCGGLAQVESAS